MSALQQINIQFRTKEGFDGREMERFKENAATLLIGAAADAGIQISLDGGDPLHTTMHVHDAQSEAACRRCVQLAQDGRA